jgi:hypothetical protein
MERIEYRNVIDKSEWRRGPWDNEPDKIQWQDDETGLPCLIVRGPAGALCGYVGVAPGHPWHGADYDNCDVSVHGGLTFAHGCAEISREKWAKWRERQYARRDEAKRYPIGDAARDLREWAKELEDYEAWEARAKSRYICHVASPGEPDPVWWLGFDCAHAGDYTPSYGRDLGMPTGWGGVVEYRNIAYVEQECRSLAKQIRGAELPSQERNAP